jgi:hypothetical protein
MFAIFGQRNWENFGILIFFSAKICYICWKTAPNIWYPPPQKKKKKKKSKEKKRKTMALMSVTYGKGGGGPPDFRTPKGWQPISEN